MVYYTGQEVNVPCRITNPDGTPATGKTVTCTVYNSGGTKIVDAQTCTPIGDGDYYYPVPFGYDSGVYSINFDCDDPVYHDAKGVYVYGQFDIDFITGEEGRESTVFGTGSSESGTYGGFIDLSEMTENAQIILRYYQSFGPGSRLADEMIIDTPLYGEENIVMLNSIESFGDGILISLEEKNFPRLDELNSYVEYSPSTELSYMCYHDGYVYVLTNDGTRLFKIDSTTYETIAEKVLPGRGTANPIVMGTHLFVPLYNEDTGTASIARIDLANFANAATIIDLGWYGNVDLCGFGDYIYVLAASYNTLMRVDTGDILKPVTISNCGINNLIDIAADSNWVYVVSSIGMIYRFDNGGDLRTADDSITLGSSLNIYSMVPDFPLIYAISYSGPSKVIQFDTDDWEVDDTLSLVSSYASVGHIFNGYLYLDVYGSSIRRLTRVNLSTFLEDTDFSLETDGQMSSIIDVDDSMILLGMRNNRSDDAYILAADSTSWGDFTRAKSLAGIRYPHGIVSDGSAKLYYIDQGTRIFQSSMSDISDPPVMIDAEVYRLYSIDYYPSGLKLYAATGDASDNHIHVFEIDTDGTFEITDDIVLTVESQVYAFDIIVDNSGDHLYVIDYGDPTGVTRIDIDGTFNRVDYLELDVTEVYGRAGVIYSGYLYIGCDNGRIAVVQLSSFTQTDVIEDPYGTTITDIIEYNGFLYAIGTDGDGNYWLMMIDPGDAVVMTRLALSAPPQSTLGTSMVISDSLLYVLCASGVGGLITVVDPETLEYLYEFYPDKGTFYGGIAAYSTSIYMPIYMIEGGISEWETRGGDNFDYAIFKEG